MEAFSLLKYWRAAGGGAGVFAARDTTASSSFSSSTATTVLTAATPSSSSDDDGSGNDDGPFFDLEFALPDDDDDDESSDSEDEPGSPENIVGDVDESDETEIKLTVSSSGGGAGIPEETAPKFPVASILKSASKFRVQMRKFNKPKSDSRQKEKVEDSRHRHRRQGDGKSGSKLLTVKLKVEEAVPLVSVLFSRDHSNSNNKSSESSKGNATKTTGAGVAEDGEEERKFAKELMNKYLKKVKPLYVRASKRYGDKLRLSPAAASPEDAEERTAPLPEKATEEAPPAGPVNKSHKQGNIQAGLRVVCKHLGKSRSASASAPPPPPRATAGTETSSSRRRDDSLLQQQDGIQSAIMHCKRSFNASRDSGSSVLSRSVR